MFNRKLTALVLGNAAYKKSPLTNAVNDAEDISERLKSLGFTVVLVKDATLEEIDQAISAFKDSEPYRVCRRVNILRDYPDDKIKIYP